MPTLHSTSGKGFPGIHVSNSKSKKGTKSKSKAEPSKGLKGKSGMSGGGKGKGGKGRYIWYYRRHHHPDPREYSDPTARAESQKFKVRTEVDRFSEMLDENVRTAQNEGGKNHE
jgi:hypothetical protein